MATLTNTKIKDTYDGLLKTTDNEALDVSGVTLIEDGLGNASALSVGRSGNGVSVSGNLAVDTNTLYVDAAGNRVGIGTNTPNFNAHIEGSALIKDKLYLQRASSGLNLPIASYWDGTVDPLTGTKGDIVAIGNTGGDGLVFVNSNQERMRIDSSGNVGIGTSSPYSTANHTALTIDGTSVSRTEYRTGGTSRARFLATSTSVNLGSTQDIPLIFETGSSNTERMRITSGGYLKVSNTGSYINPTSFSNEFVSSITNATVLNIHNTSSIPFGIDLAYTGASPNSTSNYFLVCRDSSANRLIIWSNGNVENSNNSYGAISDAKLKENIVDASPKLDDLLQVKIRNYNLIGDDKKQLGVVAQELEEVFPSMIDESPDFEEQEVIDEEGNVTKERVDLGTTTKSVKYSVFVPMLIKAMQEQQEIINDLKSRIETLENL